MIGNRITMKKNKDRKNSGFTLIETLVALAIFSTATMIALSIFISANTLQQKTIAIQKGQSDARYALELIARKIRLGEIDYEYYNQYYGGITSPMTELALRDSNGLPARFKLENNIIKMCSSFSQAGLTNTQSETCSGAWVNITPDNIYINNLKFYIAPDENPLALDENGAYLAYDQGRVTIVLESTVNPNTSQSYSTHFQTTVSSRVYKR